MFIDINNMLHVRDCVVSFIKCCEKPISTLPGVLLPTSHHPARPTPDLAGMVFACGPPTRTPGKSDLR